MKIWSVFTDDLEHCYLTGTPYCHIHHIFPGARRKRSEKRGFVIPIAANLHEFGANSIHEKPNEGLDLHLKRMAQAYYEKCYGTREDFIAEFGKSWL